MLTFKQFSIDCSPEVYFLEESRENKNLHLTHIEDSVFNGFDASVDALDLLARMRDMLAGRSSQVKITTKWDGAPAIFAGINPENGKFFVGTKGVFAGIPKLNYTNQDIDKNHPGEGLNRKLKVALKYLPELKITNILQGDMMFTAEDIKRETIEGEDYITFTPNTITYAIPLHSSLAQQILRAKLGIIWHTSYSGPTIASLKASYNVTVGQLHLTPNVWFRDAGLVDATNAATFTYEETQKVTEILKKAKEILEKISPKFLNMISLSNLRKSEISIWNNLQIRQGKEISNPYAHTVGLIKFIEDKYNKEILVLKNEASKSKKLKEKTESVKFYKDNIQQFKLIFELYNLLIEVKSMVINKLQQIKSIGTFIRTDNGFKVTQPEGFVAISDKGNVVKLINRLEFSHNNFNINKNWK